LLAGGCSEHTVRATSFVQLLQLSPPRFAALLGEHPQLRAAVEADAARWPGG